MQPCRFSNLELEVHRPQLRQYVVSGLDGGSEGWWALGLRLLERNDDCGDGGMLSSLSATDLRLLERFKDGIPSCSGAVAVKQDDAGTKDSGRAKWWCCA